PSHGQARHLHDLLDADPTREDLGRFNLEDAGIGHRHRRLLLGPQLVHRSSAVGRQSAWAANAWAYPARRPGCPGPWIWERYDTSPTASIRVRDLRRRRWCSCRRPCRRRRVRRGGCRRQAGSRRSPASPVCRPPSPGPRLLHCPILLSTAIGYASTTGPGPWGREVRRARRAGAPVAVSNLSDPPMAPLDSAGSTAGPTAASSAGFSAASAAGSGVPSAAGSTASTPPGSATRFPLFERAARAGVLDDGNAVIVAPTGTGKSFIGREVIRRAVARGEPGVHAYLVPFRALAAEIYDDFERLFAGSDVRLRIVTGEHRDALAPEAANVVVATYESFGALLTRPGFRPGVVVADEVHLIADDDRGPVVEGLFARLLVGRRARGLCALSAVVG